MYKNEVVKTEIQNLINETIPMTEKYILSEGSFIPYYFIIDNKDKKELAMVFSNERVSNTSEFIEQQSKAIRNSISNKVKLIILVFSSNINSPISGKKIDAISTYVEHKENKEALLFHYPYVIENKEIVYENSIGDQLKKSILK